MRCVSTVILVVDLVGLPRTPYVFQMSSSIRFYNARSGCARLFVRRHGFILNPYSDMHLHMSSLSCSMKMIYQQLAKPMSVLRASATRRTLHYALSAFLRRQINFITTVMLSLVAEAKLIWLFGEAGNIETEANIPDMAGHSSGNHGSTKKTSGNSKKNMGGKGLKWQFRTKSNEIGYELKYFDPFLLLDEFSVTAPAGFPDHPHRGFETVTYMLEGAVTHEDFEGHRGTIRGGDLQWMTAGKGIVHSEMPSGPGPAKGLQLWINLSAENKMMEPRYQEIESKEIKTTTSKDGNISIRVIAGKYNEIQSTVHTKTPTLFLDITLKPSAHILQPLPQKWNSFAYVLEGEGVFGSEKTSPAGPHNILLLGDGDGLHVWNKSKKTLRFLLLGGKPLDEPVAQFGPFVMNGEDEIDQAIHDYQYCVNGFEKAKNWKSGKVLIDLQH